MKNLLILILAVPFILGAAKLGHDSLGEYPVPLEPKLQKHIISVSEAYNVDPTIIFAIIEKESQYDERAVGDSGGSFGLMQINAQSHPDRMEKLCVSNLMCPYCNVIVGIDYFAECLAVYEDVHMALIRFNAGQTNANAGWFSVGRYQSDYSREVMAIAERIGGATNGMG